MGVQVPALRRQGDVHKPLRVPQHREHGDKIWLVVVPFQTVLLGHGCLKQRHRKTRGQRCDKLRRDPGLSDIQDTGAW